MSERFRKAWMCALVVCLAAGVTVRAWDDPDGDISHLSLEQLLKVEIDNVVGASRYVQDIRHAPSSVTVLSREDILESGYRTLGDVLRTVRGLSVRDDHNYEYLGVRGFDRPGDYNGRVLVLLDGHRLNDDVYEQVLLGRDFPVDLSLVERIEIIRGPSSSLYGTSAVFAVINVMTRRGRDLNGRAELAIGGGSSMSREAGVTWGGALPTGFDVLFSANGYGTDGENRLVFPDLAGGPGVATGLDAESSRNVFFKASRRELSFEAGYGRRRKQVPTAAFGSVFGDPRLVTVDVRSFANLEYGKTLSRRADVVVRGFWDATEYTGDYPMASGPSDLAHDWARGASAGTEVLFTYRRARHTLTAGTEYRYRFHIDQTFVDPTNPLLAVGARHREQVSGVYGQDEFAITPDLTLNAGVRLDHYSVFGATAHPRLAIVIGPARETTLKLMFGSAFAEPNAYQRYYYPLGVVADLTPETITTTEAELSHRFRGGLRATASIYSYRMKDLINEDGSGEQIVYRNLGRATANGVEAGLDGRWANGGRISASLTYTDVRDESTQSWLNNSPHWLTKATATVPVVPRRVLLTSNTFYTSSRLTNDGSLVDGYLRQDFGVWVPQIAPSIDLAFTVTNAFDSRFSEPAAQEHPEQTIPQARRAVSARMVWRY